MLTWLGLILIFAQFAVDGWAIYKQAVTLTSVQDFVSFFLVGIAGMICVILGKMWSNHKVDRLEEELEEIEWEDE